MTSAPALNEAALRADARRERLRLGALTAPSTFVIAATLVVPFLWLLFLSFQGERGWTLANYERLLGVAHVSTMFTTLELAFWVTFFCGLIGYPTAYFLRLLPKRWAAFGILCVLLPFWTAILVRTYAWMVILQRRGLLNEFLLDRGWIDEPLRMVNNMFGTAVGLVHILLPFLVLPLYAAMRSVDIGLIRAAASLGATPARAFWTVFFPLTLPGLIGGLLMVFVLCLGSYVTPAILGGGRLVVWPQSVANAVEQYTDWGVAGAMGVVLLVVTLGLTGVLGRLLRMDLLTGDRR
jgi:putative spermidine/putrescine transport system permease protein/spermidine/putrescine transport system permease protein